MATGNSEIISKELEAARSGHEGTSDLPPPYTDEPQVYSYDQHDAGKAVPSAPAGYYQPQPGYAARPQDTAGYSSVRVMPRPPGNANLIPPEHFVIQREQVIQRQPESFVKQIVMSCCVFWLCCWPLGLTAFILALMANSKARSPDEYSVREAHRLGVHSWRTSIAGIIIGVILLTTLIILRVTSNSEPDPNNHL